MQRELYTDKPDGKPFHFTLDGWDSPAHYKKSAPQNIRIYLWDKNNNKGYRFYLPKNNLPAYAKIIKDNTVKLTCGTQGIAHVVLGKLGGAYLKDIEISFQPDNDIETPRKKEQFPNGTYISLKIKIPKLNENTIKTIKSICSKLNLAATNKESLNKYFNNLATLLRIPIQELALLQANEPKFEKIILTHSHICYNESNKTNEYKLKLRRTKLKKDDADYTLKELKAKTSIILHIPDGKIESNTISNNIP